MTSRPAGTTGRIPELDGLRGLAILLVVVWHYAGHPLRFLETPVALFASRPARLMSTGVDLFFVLSGFLIGGILLDQRDSPGYFKAFYSRRALRILPIYALWLGLFLLLPRLVPALLTNPGSAHLFAHPLPTWSYATFTQNFAMVERGSFGPEWLAITWSLAIEEQFYLALPLLIRFVPRRPLPWVLLALGALAPLLRLASGLDAFFVNNVLTPWRADSLLLGVLCAWALRQERLRSAIAAHRRELYLLGGGILALLLSFSFFEFAGFLRSPMTPLAFALVYAALLLLGVTEPRGPASWLLRRRWLRALGIVAYGVYLLHQGVNGLLHAVLRAKPPSLEGAGGLATTLLAAAVTCTLAALSWHLFEKPLVALGHRVGYGAPTPARTSGPPEDRGGPRPGVQPSSGA